MADTRLSPRERQVWLLLVQGKSNQEIASTLGLALGTVKTYLSRLYRKLGVSSRLEAALMYYASQAQHLAVFGEPDYE